MGNTPFKTYKVDYFKKFNDNFKLSLGSRYANVDTDNDLQSYRANDQGAFVFLIEEESSQFLIDETIFAVYAKLNASKGKWSFSGGLRYEDSNTDGTSIFMQGGTPEVSIK